MTAHLFARSRPRFLIALFATLALVGGGIATAVVAYAATDYTQGVTSLGATQAKIWFKPTTASALVDVHYLIAGQPQQNFRMANNAGTWGQTVSALATGTVISYWFTYEKGGPLFDTPKFSYTHGGGGGDPGTVARPVLSPGPGSYAASVQVAITTSTMGAVIHYTLDGSTPTGSSQTYTGPITISSTRTLRAIGTKSGLAKSAVAGGTYTIGAGCGNNCGGGGPGTFPMRFANNTGGRWANNQIFITIIGMGSPGEWSYLKPNGSWTHINHADTDAPGHLTKNGRNYPNMSFSLARATTVNIPTFTTGGRVYISLGSPVYLPVSPDNRGWGGPDLNNPSDPNQDVYFDWYEYTYVFGQTPFGGNTTQVDQFGFPLTVRLQQAASGYDRTAGITQSRAQVMSGYQAAVAPAFRRLANTFRILAPRTSTAFKPAGAQANYFQAYIDQVWNFYTTHQWTENDHGVILTGRVSGGVLTGTRTNDGAPFSVRKPTSTEVVECSGALALPTEVGGNDLIRAVGRDFCAAFHRGVALDTAFWFDPAKYYQTNPRDDYAAFFHGISVNKRSYAFAYDDVNDQSSVQILGNSDPPNLLTLGIGW